MEKEQIIKALECCANYQNFRDCDKCPAREGCDTENNFLEREALSLIREQEKRIEKLENICNSYAMQYGTATDKEVFLKKERADTVRKMVERLKEKAMDVDMDDATLWMSCVPVDDVDQIAKQLTEDKA